MTKTVCAVDACDRDARARGWCGKHWQRWRRTGHPEGSTSHPRRDSRRHGSRRGYELGCRCLPCAVANSRYHGQHRNGRRARVPAAQVIAHLDTLIDSGWTRREVQDECGLGNSTVWTIMSGRVASVNSRTADAILALAPLPDPVTLDPAPLLDALAGRGMGISRAHLNEANSQACYRARREGRISDVLADRIAVEVLGLTLEEIYGPDWDDQAVPA